MKILHVIQSLDQSLGGQLSALKLQLKLCRRLGITADVVGTCGRGETVSNDIITYANNTIHFSAEDRFLRYNSRLRNYLRSIISAYDLVHIHGLYRLPGTFAAQACIRNGTPYVIQPHGVFSPHYWNEPARSTLRKLYRTAFDRPLIARASGLVVTSTLESDWTTALGFNGPRYVVPFPLDEMGIPDPAIPLAPDRPLTVLFLARITRSKGAHIALEAFRQLRSREPSIQLRVCGPDSEQLMRQMGFSIGIETDGITYVGEVYGEEKARELRSTRALIIPSKTENFCLAAGEALANGVPVIGTSEIGLLHEQACSPLVFVSNSVEPADFASLLSLAINGTTPNLPEAARIRREYSSERAGEALSGAYKQAIVGAAPRGEAQ